jgi:hypothetical protein
MIENLFSAYDPANSLGISEIAAAAPVATANPWMTLATPVLSALASKRQPSPESQLNSMRTAQLKRNLAKM